MKNKTFSIVFMFFLILCCFIPSVFAADSDNWFEQRDTAFEEYIKVIQKYYNDNNLTLYDFFACKDGYIYTFSKSDFEYYIDNSNHVHADSSCYLFAFKENATTDLTYNLHKDLNISWGMTSGNIYKSSFDMKNSNGDVFFYATPLSLGQVLTIKATIIPSTILGILPLIIVVVVSFLGLRKALKMLVTFLNRS